MARTSGICCGCDCGRCFTQPKSRDLDAALRNAPAIVVRVELERNPRVFLDCTNEGEARRLRDWLGAPVVRSVLEHLLESTPDSLMPPGACGEVSS